MNVPENLYYTESHEWIKVDGNTITMGITDHAQHELGDIVFVELPGSDDTCSAKQALGTIESVKAVSEFYSPVDGTVAEANEELESSPETLNSDPYEGGWIVKITTDSFDAGAFLDASAYKKLLETGA